MDEPFKKLLLKSNSILKKPTLISINGKKESFTSLINITTHNNQNYVFQSFAKQYGKSILKNAQLESVNDKRRIAKTPKNFNFKRGDKKQSIMKRAKTLQT